MQCLIVGDANADVSAILPHFPSEGDDCQLRAFRWGSGGSAANVAVALARLDIPTRLLACVGNDPAAEVALHAAQAANVDLSQIQRHPTCATGVCFVAISPGGERTFFSHRGANSMVTLADPQIVLERVTWVHLSAYALLDGPQRTSTHHLIAAAYQRNIPISLDLCLPLIHAHPNDILDCLPQIHILFTNEPECRALLPDRTWKAALDDIIASGTTVVVLKRGAQGCMISTRNNSWKLPAFTITAIDSTGCGDAFVAAFLAAYAQNLPLPACATFGNAAGALAATRIGATESLPGRSELEAFLVTKGATQ